MWKCFHTSNKIASAWRNKRIIIYFKSLLCFYRLSFFRAPRICAVNLFFKGGTIPRFLTIYICSPSQDISLNGIVKFLWSHLLSCHCFKRPKNFQSWGFSRDRHLLLLTRERSPSDDHPRHLKRILFEKLYYEYFISMKAPFEKQARRQLEKLKSFFIVTQRIPRGNTFWMNAVFENNLKSLILQHCDRSELTLLINVFSLQNSV